MVYCDKYCTLHNLIFPHVPVKTRLKKQSKNTIAGWVCTLVTCRDRQTGMRLCPVPRGSAFFAYSASTFPELYNYPNTSINSKQTTAHRTTQINYLSPIVNITWLLI